MVYVFDTNIILLAIINPAFNKYIKKAYRKESNDLIISAVTQGELQSLAIQRN